MVVVEFYRFFTPLALWEVFPTLFWFVFSFFSVVFFQSFFPIFCLCFVRYFGGEGVLEFYDRQVV